MEQGKPLKTFVIYSHDDHEYKDALVKWLKVSLVQSGKIELWHDGDIPLGYDWDATIKENLEGAELVLILVSTSALASSYISSTEMKITFDRLKEGVVRVVPIILKHCPWKFNPNLAGLQGLPQDMKPISDASDQDKVWMEIINKLDGLVNAIWAEEVTKPKEKPAVAREETRITDAIDAPKSNISVDRLRGLIGKGMSKEALEQLVSSPLSQSDMQMAISLKARLSQLEKSEMLGVLSRNEANIERNQITAALLSLINKLA
jgi:Effector-associated domain 11/TIR domain